MDVKKLAVLVVLFIILSMSLVSSTTTISDLKVIVERIEVNGDVQVNRNITSSGKICDSVGCIQPFQVFGSGFERFENLSQSFTNLSVLQTQLDITTSNKTAGTYRIAFFADVTGGLGGKTFNVEFSVDGVAIGEHDDGEDYYTLERKSAYDWKALSSIQYKVLSSNATIDAAIKFSAGSSPAIISNAVIEIWRVE